MEKETTNACAQCGLFRAGECTLHRLVVCYNDEACKDFMDKEPPVHIIEKIEKKWNYLTKLMKSHE